MGYLIEAKWHLYAVKSTKKSLVQIMACHLFGAKPLSKPMLIYFVSWTLRNQLQWNFNPNTKIFIEENAFENIIWKWWPLCIGLNALFHLCRTGATFIATEHPGPAQFRVGWPPRVVVPIYWNSQSASRILQLLGYAVHLGKNAENHLATS